MSHDILYLSSAGARWTAPDGASRARTPVRVVADYVEESLVRIVLPHVSARDLRALVDRRLAQEFRETPYRTAIKLSRDRHAKTIDYLLLALPPASSLNVHLQPLVDAGRPLAGVWTVSLLIGEWARRARVRTRAQLVVLPTPAGTRHVFLEYGTPVLSRLISTGDGTHADPLAELGRTVQYLYNARLIERGTEIDTWRWGDAATAETDVPGARFVPTPTARGLPDPVRGGFGALIELLQRTPPPVQLAPDSLRVRHHARRARHALAIAASTAVVALLAGSAYESYRVHRLKREAAIVAQEVQQRQAALAALNRGFADVGADASTVRDAVAAHRTLVATAPDLRAGLALASLGFEAAPAYRLETLRWYYDDGHGTDSGREGACPPPAAAPAEGEAAASATETHPSLGITLTGTLDSRLGLREAILVRQRFEAAYRGRDDVVLGSTQPPVDASADGVIRGGIDEGANARGFSYCLEWRFRR